MTHCQGVLHPVWWRILWRRRGVTGCVKWQITSIYMENTTRCQDGKMPRCRDAGMLAVCVIDAGRACLESWWLRSSRNHQGGAGKPHTAGKTIKLAWCGGERGTGRQSVPTSRNWAKKSGQEVSSGRHLSPFYEVQLHSSCRLKFTHMGASNWLH